jgi:hypothetical protein
MRTTHCYRYYDCVVDDDNVSIPPGPDSLIHRGVSASKTADRAATLSAVGEYRRPMKALKFNPIVSGRGVKFSQLHPKDDNLADVLPNPSSHTRS